MRVLIDTAGMLVDATHWNTESSGVDWAIGNTQAGAGGLTTDAMRQKASFVGWDFDRLWNIGDARNDGFPYLRGLPFAGMDLNPEIVAISTPALLEWLDAKAGGWGSVELKLIGVADLLAAQLLDRPPEPGLAQRIELRVDGIRPEDGEIALTLDLRLGEVPHTGGVNGNVAVEGAAALEGPWHRVAPATDDAGFVQGRRELRIPGGDSRFFRALLIPGSPD